MSTLSCVVTRRGETKSQRIGFIPDTTPEAISSQTGVSTTFALPINCPEPMCTKNKVAHSHAIKCTYGRERQFEFFSKQGIETFYPTITYRKIIDGMNETIYKGIKCTVKRYKGQQRVGLVVGEFNKQQCDGYFYN